MKNLLYGENGMSLYLSVQMELFAEIIKSNGKYRSICCCIKRTFSNQIDAEPNPELVSQLSQEIYQNDLLQLLVSNMPRLEFEVSEFGCNFIGLIKSNSGKERCGSDIQ